LSFSNTHHFYARRHFGRFSRKSAADGATLGRNNWLEVEVKVSSANESGSSLEQTVLLLG
jgi:hypothetical protein